MVSIYKVEGINMQEEKEIETTEQINPYQSIDGLLKEFEQNYKGKWAYTHNLHLWKQQ